MCAWSLTTISRPSLSMMLRLTLDSAISRARAVSYTHLVDENVVERYTFERKTHNAGVFDVYTPEMRACRSAHIKMCIRDRS